MRTLTFLLVGILGATLCAAVGARLSVYHVLPDISVIIIVFVSLRREPALIAATALSLGYMTARQALAPAGLHECALVLTAVGTFLSAASLAGSGALFFALTCGVAVMAYHALLFLLMLWSRGEVGFASWAAAALLPNALATCCLALLLHPWLLRLDRRLAQDKREGLTWR